MKTVVFFQFIEDGFDEETSVRDTTGLLRIKDLG